MAQPDSNEEQDGPQDLELVCHANNAFRVLRIEGSIAVRSRGKIVALNSSGVETVLFENKTDREQMVVSDTNQIFVVAS